MSTFDEIAEWLSAQLDEDADDANTLAIHRDDCAWFPVGDGCSHPCDCDVPKGLLREVEAKRRLIDYFREPFENGNLDEDGLRILASGYSHRNGYKAAWAPTAPAGS